MAQFVVVVSETNAVVLLLGFPTFQTIYRLIYCCFSSVYCY